MTDDIISSYSIINNKTGETVDVKDAIPTGHSDNKFIKRGYKMYNDGLLDMIDVLTKEEFKRTVRLFDAKNVDYYNILKKPFHKITEDMSRAARSRFKKKLLDNNIVGEFNNKYMLNPHMFIPRGDKNVLNCNNLTQRTWTYMFLDHDKYSEDIEDHIYRIFGEDSLIESNKIKIRDRFRNKDVYLDKPKNS